ncbi:MAG: CHAT domain-containing protein [Cytophagales bacterium]|nr:CHAT domain-containing protein [Cytophagales bacterium]
MRTGFWFLLLLIFLDFQYCSAQTEELQNSLNLEDPLAALFYIKRIDNANTRHLFLAEVALLEEQYKKLDSTLNLIAVPKLNSNQLIKFKILEAVSFHRRNALAESQVRFKHAEELLKKTSDRMDRATFNYWKGFCLLEQNQLATSETHLRRALSFYRKDSLTYKVKIARLYFWIGTNKLRNNVVDSALYYLNKSLSIYTDLPLDKSNMLIKLYNNLGAAYHEGWNYSQAKENYENAIKLNKAKLNNPDELALACANLGQFYDTYENYIQSKEWHREAIQWAEKSTLDPARKALIFQNYGAALVSQYENELALNNYRYALQIIAPHKANNAEVYLRIANNMVAVYINNMQFDEAEKWQLEIENFLGAYPPEWSAIANELELNKATMKALVGDTTSALAILNKLEESQKNKDSRFYYRVIQNKAACLKTVNAGKVARSYLNLLIKYYSSIFPSSHPQIIYLYNEIGNSYSYSQSDSARYYFALAKKNNLLAAAGKDFYASKMEWIVSNFNLIQLELKSYNEGLSSLKQLEIAHGLIQSNLAVIQTQRNELQTEAEKLNLNRLLRAFYQLSIDYYYLLYEQTKDPIYIDRAFQISGQTKNQNLLNSMKLDRVKSFARVTEDILKEEVRLAKSTSQLEFQYSQELSKQVEPNQELLKEYLVQLQTNTTRYNHLIDSIKKNLPSYHALKFNQQLATPSEISETYLVKHPASAWIEYTEGKQNNYCILILPQRSYFLKVGKNVDIGRHVRALKNSIVVQESNGFYTSSSALQTMVFAKPDSCLQMQKTAIKQLIIVPNEQLSFVNFELLSARAKNKWTYNLTKYQFSYGYSSTLLVRESANTLPAKTKLTLLAFAPEFNTPQGSYTLRNQYDLNPTMEKFNFLPLLKNQQEIINASQILKSHKNITKIYVGAAADETSFKTEQLSEYTIIHLATHGFVDLNNQYNPGIAFAPSRNSNDDGILYLDEIFSLRSNAHLICLSACETGLGNINIGEGIMGLTRAFIYSGTKNLIVSLWKVNDDSTEKFMTEFYRRMAKSASIAESLRGAKLAFLKSNPALAPHHWSAFVHIGLN